MCTVSVNVNETTLREVRPDLDTTAAIRLWAQQLIDLHIQQMELEDTETVSLEEAREMLHRTIREVYAEP